MKFGDFETVKGVYDYRSLKPTKLGKWLCSKGFHRKKEFTHFNQYHYYICIRCGMNCGPV